MNSFKNIQELLLLSYVNNVVSDREFVLYDTYQSKNPDFNYQQYEPFNLDNIDSAECKAELCIEKADLPRLAEVLQLPPTFHCQQRTVFDSMEGLCMCLKRVSYRCRYSDMIPRIGRLVSVLSLRTNPTLDYIYENHGHLITQWNGNILNPRALQSYADSTSRKGAPLINCFGLIDGTIRLISRPGHAQRVVYNGHKRVHSLKFQSLVLPNGVIGKMFGPVEGHKHDAGMLADSGLLTNLQRFAISPTGQPMCIYGDPAYPLRVHLQAPFRQGRLTAQMQAYNNTMSEVRVPIEWLFGDTINS